MTKENKKQVEKNKLLENLKNKIRKKAFWISYQSMGVKPSNNSFGEYHIKLDDFYNEVNKIIDLK